MGGIGQHRPGHPLAPTLPQLLSAVAQDSPGRVAFGVGAGAGLSYLEWEMRARAIAAGLHGSGIPSGHVVGVRAEGWADFAAALLGVLWGGFVAIPLPPHLGEVEAARVLRTAGAVAVLSPSAVLPPGVRALDPAALAQEATGAEPAIAAAPGEVAMVLCRAGRLTRSRSTTMTHGELLQGPLPEFERGEEAALLHLFSPGGRHAHHVVRVVLAAAPLRAEALDGCDLDGVVARVAAEDCAACILHPAVAHAVTDPAAENGADLSRVRWVMLTGATDAPVLARVGRAFPQARVAAAPAASGATTAGPDGVDGGVITAPVAPSQEGMLWREVFAPGCQNLPGLARRYRGFLDVVALERALDEIVRRHAPLRTTFEVRAGRLLQIVHPHRRRRLGVRDLGTLDEEERKRRVEAAVAAAGTRPFDLVAGPLFEPTLLRLAADDHVLVIRTHHAVFDDWSVGVFRRDLEALYRAFTKQEGAPLPDLATSFPRFAENVRQRLAGSEGERDRAFWRGELAGAPLLTQLRTDDPAGPQGGSQPSAGPMTVALSPELCAGVRKVARRSRATVFMTMLAAFATLVAREEGRDDLLLATVVANRNRTELEHLVGCFTKKVPLRLRLHGQPSFTEVVARARSSLLAALSHAAPAFEAVLQDALGSVAAAHGLVPHVALVFQGVTPRRELVLPAVETTGFETAARITRAHFAATHPAGAPWGSGLYAGSFLILSLEDDGASIALTARGAFFEPAVTELLERYRALLTRLVADPAAPALAPPEPQPDPDLLELHGARIDRRRMQEVLRGWSALEDADVRLESAGGEARLVAEIAPAGMPPSLAKLRAHLWTELPGYAWPAQVRVRSRPGEVLRPSETRQTLALRSLWAQVRGVQVHRVRPSDNYWQDFSFLEALEEGRNAGLPIPATAVTRNRTIEALGVALAARAPTRRQPSVW